MKKNTKNKKNMFSKIISILLCLFMVITVAGCKDESSSSEEQTDQTAVQATEEQADDTEEDSSEEASDKDPFGKYEPAIQLTYAKVFTQKNFDQMEALGWDKNDTIWTRAFKDELGIELVLKWDAADSDDYVEKMGLAVSSGDTPDLIDAKLDFSLIKQLAEVGAIADITDLIDEYASPYFKDSLNKAGANVFYPVTFEGKIMGLPQIQGAENSSKCFTWIRRDWLDNLDLDEPENMDDLIEVIKAFTDNDPDQNGEDDTVGLTFTSDVVNAVIPFLNSYHAYPEIWVDPDKDGILEYGSIMPEAKEGLSVLTELYKDGYIDQEFNTKTDEKAREMYASGKCGIVFAEQYVGLTYLSDSFNNDNNADWYPYYLLSSDDQPASPQSGANAVNFFCISSGYSNPEALIKLFNFHTMKLWDPDTTSQELNYEFGNDQDGNEIWQLSPVAYEPPGKNYYVNALGSREALMAGDRSIMTMPEQFLVYDYVVKYTVDGDSAFWGWNKIYGLEGSNYFMGRYLEEGLFVQNEFFSAPSDTMATLKVGLDTMEMEAYANIITGKESVDYFDTFVEEWKAAGGDTCTEEVNEWYSEIG